jgi:murein DD-endopeptidase MepM/ murein hydrolase activator NlpD
MRVLSRDDALFVQLQADLDAWYRQTADPAATAGRAETSRAAAAPLVILAYRRRGEDLFGLNARLNLPYDTLVTLNAAASRAEFEALGTILVPSRPGLFVSETPASALEDMMLADRMSRGLVPERVVVRRGGRAVALLFFPGEYFNAVERAYFLRILYEFPIVRGSITSRFGTRADPFTGHPSFHGGIDIGAAEGTPVHAARDGTVAEVAVNAVLGTYVVLEHAGGWQSVYGHLSAVTVAAGSAVATGTVIGAVGSTGRSTGPHLHFEVRRKGSAVDPFPLLAQKKID